MQKNVGGYDRLARFVFGPLLVVVGISHFAELVTVASGTLDLAVATVAILVGAVFLVTATTRKYPLNSVLGRNTHRPRETTDADVESVETGRVGGTN